MKRSKGQNYLCKLKSPAEQLAGRKEFMNIMINEANAVYTATNN